MRLHAGAALVAAALLAGRATQEWGPAALAGAAFAAWAWRQDRSWARVWGLVPAAVWVATRDPWTPLVSAVILAGASLILLGRLGLEGSTRDQALGLGAGAAAGLVTGLLASLGAGIAGTDAVALAVTLVAVRAVAVTLPDWTPTLYATALSAPWWAGAWAWGLAAAEGLGMALVATPLPERARAAYALGGVAGLVAVL